MEDFVFEKMNKRRKAQRTREWKWERRRDRRGQMRTRVFVWLQSCQLWCQTTPFPFSLIALVSHRNPRCFKSRTWFSRIRGAQSPRILFLLLCPSTPVRRVLAALRPGIRGTVRLNTPNFALCTVLDAAPYCLQRYSLREV